MPMRTRKNFISTDHQMDGEHSATLGPGDMQLQSRQRKGNKQKRKYVTALAENTDELQENVVRTAKSLKRALASTRHSQSPTTVMIKRDDSDSDSGDGKSKSGVCHGQSASGRSLSSNTNSNSPVNKDALFTSILDKNVKTEMPVKSEENVLYDDSDEDQENLNYMQIRMQNMKDNENFLASIGVFKAKEELKQTMMPPKKTVSHRGLKIKREPVEPLPRRKSLRINKLDPLGNPVQDSESSTSTVRSMDSIPFGQLFFDKEEVSVRLPEGPVNMKDCVYSKHEKEKATQDVDQFVSFIHKEERNLAKAKNDDYVSHERFEKMSLAEEHVAKVVPERVFSLDWYPSTDKLMVVAGDKCGHVGFWNVMAEEKDGVEIVTAFKPHVKPVSQLSFAHSYKHKLFSSSYDGTLRCLDFEKHVFDEIFSISEEEDDLLRDFSFVDSNTMLVAHYTGFFSVVDIRTSPSSAENSYMASKKNLHTIHVNPQSSNHFITTGADATINLWDFRHLSKKLPKPVYSTKDHSKTVSSAYFSPNGQQILSCSADDTILVYSVQNSTTATLSKRIRHNNCTGRWLTKFRPTWHPTVGNVFVSGSMARPRRVEVFNASTGSIISCVESDNLNSVCSLNKFHPLQPTILAGANSSGRLHIFM